MGSSLSKLDAAFSDAPTEAKKEQTKRPRETPTRESMEAVKLAEAESLLALSEPTPNVNEGSRVMVARQRWNDDFELETDLVEDLTAAEPEPFEVDPFGGLVPVVEEVDPFGGLIPIVDGTQDAAPPSEDEPLELDEIPAAIDGGSLHRIPRLSAPQSEILRLPIDARAGFMLSHVDGVQTVEEILDVCPMPPEEAFQLFERLEALGVITFVD